MSDMQFSDNFLTVVILESRWSHIYVCTRDKSGEIKSSKVSDWDPSVYQTDIDGRRLFEETVRRVRSAWGECGGCTPGIVVTMPGTLSGTDTIMSSSRLGIRQRAPIASVVSDGLGVPCRVFHDVECLAIGEIQRLGRVEDLTLVYILVDEGIGSKTIIDEKIHAGAGTAGLLGRLTVQPDGAYFRALAARGPLEVFSSRPWISENLVSAFLSEQGKKGGNPEALESTRFRRALRVAANGDWSSLDYDYIADGINDRDPVATQVIDVAAHYLALAINSVITILHPHKIILGGSMITQLPRFADLTVSYARRYSWRNAWNATEIAISNLGRQPQVDGAIYLWSTYSS